MNGNDFMAWLLRSPLNSILGDMMLITVTGRKTGKKYTTPVGYFEENGCLWILTSRDRSWWKNLRGGAEVELLLKRKLVCAFAELELNESAVEARLVEYLQHVPQAAKPMGVHMQDKTPNPEDITRLAKERLFVKIRSLK